MTIRYRVRDWNKHFEHASSRKLESPVYLSVPNKHHGKGLGRILREPDGAAIFGIWILVIQACSRQRRPRHGFLTDDGTNSGLPLGVADLSHDLKRPADEIERALTFLSSPRVGWMEAEVIADVAPKEEENPPIVRQSSASDPPTDAQRRVSRVSRVEESRVDESAAAGLFDGPPTKRTEEQVIAQRRLLLRQYRFRVPKDHPEDEQIALAIFVEHGDEITVRALKACSMRHPKEPTWIDELQDEVAGILEPLGQLPKVQPDPVLARALAMVDRMGWSEARKRLSCANAIRSDADIRDAMRENPALAAEMIQERA